MGNMRGQHPKKDQAEHTTVLLDDIKSKLGFFSANFKEATVTHLEPHATRAQ